MSYRGFGPFQVNLVTGELQRDGAPVRLQPVLSRLLVELASRPGELVERRQLIERLWPSGTFVDYENSLNNAIARLRGIIGLHRIQTIPQRGYRFLGKRTQRVRIPNPEAAQGVARGMHLVQRATKSSVTAGVKALTDAVALDSGWALAHAELAHAYILLGDELIGGANARTSLVRAEQSAREALSLHDASPQALAAMGMIEWRLRWDWKSAENYFRAAIAADCHYAMAHQYYSWWLQARRRQPESLSEIEQARRLAPTSPFVSTNVAWMLYNARQYSRAARQLTDALELDPYYAMAYVPLGLCTARLGDPIGAVHYLSRANRLAGHGSRFYSAMLGNGLAAVGRTERAWRVGSESQPFETALIHLGLREYGPAIDCLEEARRTDCSHLAYIMVDPLLDPIRSDKRILRIAQSIGLE